MVNINEMDPLNPCNLVSNAAKVLSFLAHCRRVWKGIRGLVGSVGGWEGRDASSSENKRTPSVNTAMSSST
jgi:hypothetical protein